MKYCIECSGKDNELKPLENFYKSTSLLFSDGYVPICKDCIQNLAYDEEADMVDMEAFRKILQQIDKPFIESAFQSAIGEYNKHYEGLPVPKGNRKKIVALYFKSIQKYPYKDLTWDGGVEQNNSELHKRGVETLLNSESPYPILTSRSKEVQEVKWSKADKRNMEYAISVVGYDPFEACGLTESDRKYCYNTLAGYCGAEGIQSDGHKIQSVIQIVQSQLQCRKLDELINVELFQDMPDEKKIKSIAETKARLLAAIAKIAQDNNLASAYNSNSKAGKNTLTMKIKEALEDGFEDIKVNRFDIETCEAMKQIADLSNRSLFEQLNLDANDFTSMLTELRSKYIALQEQYAALEEENRIMKNQLAELTAKKKK